MHCQALLPALTALALLAAPAAPAQCARQAPDTRVPQVLVLGTYHMGGSGDRFATAADDILSAERQRQVEDVVNALACFRPTRIAVEIPVTEDSALNARYARYVAGRDTLLRSETYQIGFRLARRLGHARVYPVDYRMSEDIGPVVQYAAAHGDTGFVNLVQRFGVRMKAAGDSMPALPLTEILRRMNSPAYLDQEANYLRMARVGQDTTYVGADVVAARYRRNLRIYANLARVVGPGERVLVIYGAGHGKLLRDYLGGVGDYELVPAERFLPPSPRAR